MGRKRNREEREIHEILELEREILAGQHPHHVLPTSISFTERTMNPTAAGQNQVFTGVFAPARLHPSHRCSLHDCVK